MEKTRKRMTKACLLAVLAAGMAATPRLPSLAAGGDIPFIPRAEQGKVTEEKGSIRIKLTDGAEGTDRQGVVFSYAKVADWDDGTYEVAGQFSASGVDLEQIETAAQLEEAATRFAALMGQGDGTAVTDGQGQAKVQGLETGVYLFSVKDRASYEEIAPFLVAIPTWNEYSGEMLYEVEVLPKHTPIPKGPPGGGVETGDGNGGVFHGSLMALAATGGILVFRSRRERRRG